MNHGHGHVHPREDGVKARCGGPALCSHCAPDLASQDAPIFGSGYLMVLPGGQYRRLDPETVMIRQSSATPQEAKE
jgi:hypothetical protein